MKILSTLGNESGSNDYVVRPTAKAIVINDKGETLLFSDLLLGGGIDEGETAEQALHRECMEEAGVTIEIIRPLGTVIQYREFIGKKYEVHGFLAKISSEDNSPTTLQDDEIGKKTKWVKIADARVIFEEKIKSLNELDPELKNTDGHQGKLFNTQTALEFLNEVESDSTLN